MNRLSMVGISHENTTIEEREEYALTKPRSYFENLLISKKIDGFVIVRTCLRLEIYFDTCCNETIEEIRKSYSYNRKVFVKNGLEAAKHLFELSCGFLSVITGEDQILNQIKESYNKALENGHTSKYLNIVFNHAMGLGRKFRRESRINHTPLSLENISIKFIESRAGVLSDKKILVVGTGELAKSIVFILHSKHADNLTVTGRRSEKLDEIRGMHKGLKTLDYEMKNKAFIDNEIIITATSAPHFIFYDNEIAGMLDGTPKFILDLAVPRDVDEKIGEHEGIELHNLDHIWEIYNKNYRDKNDIAEKYSCLVGEELKKLTGRRDMGSL